MPRRRVMKGALDGFLGTFTSRYSDHLGFWVFGFLVPEGLPWTLRLEHPPADEGDPRSAVARLAHSAFWSQVDRHRLPRAQVTAARLEMGIVEPARGRVNGHPVAGYHVRIAVHAVVDTGTAHAARRTIFVAPHDPGVELRRPV